MNLPQYLSKYSKLLKKKNFDENSFQKEWQQLILNLDREIISKIEKSTGLTFISEKEEGNVCMANSAEVLSDFRTTFAPIDLLDYIYAVLHSPEYREKYKEFLKIDFPRVPYPTDQEEFWKLKELGAELRQLHLLKSDKGENPSPNIP